MRKTVSLLMMVSLLLSLAGCAGSGSSQQVPESVTAPAVSFSAPSPAAPAPAPPEPTKHGPLPAPVVKQDARQLYPAYAFVDGARQWGYVDPAGKFVIQPIYDRVAEFESDGLAIVRQGDKYGLINKGGVKVVTPEWDWIEPANDDLVRVLAKGQARQTVDSAGKLLFGEPSVTGNFGSGLAPYRNEAGLFGYVNRAGEVVIPAQFRSTYAFHDGKAVVKTGEGSYAVIDATGKRLGEFSANWADSVSEGLIAFDDSATHRSGYVSVTGQVVLPATFDRAWPFKDGLAVVSTSDSYPPLKGLINTRGEFVIPEAYAALEPLGAGLYAAARPTKIATPAEFMPMALLTREGRQLTDFRYYNPQPVAQGLISVSDGKETFFLDTQGKPAQGMPSVPGFGTLKVEGALIRADVDGRVRYLSRDGQIVWQGDNKMTLAGGLRVVEQKYRPNMATLISYPEFAGLADPKAQEALNQRLRAAFIGGESAQTQDAKEQQATIDAGFTVRQLKDLVILSKSGYWFGWGAAHGMPSRDYYQIDTKTGTIYTLADLFKHGSNFTDRLREIIRKQIATRPEKPMQENPEVKTSQAFYISADALTIYYRPYEIASYAQGFIEFSIPWSEVSDLIDTNGPFWKSFH